MKELWRVVLVSGVFLTGCVSSLTYEEKQDELNAKQKELAACETRATRATSDLAACVPARTEAESKLAAATRELSGYRQVAEAKQRKVDELQKQENDLRARLSQELTDKNVEIEQLRGQLSVRMLDKIVFKSGSAEILPQGMEVLDKLADAIKDSTDTIRVEGHTDDTPISDKLKTKYPSNWELSAARASAVARYFETKHYINPRRLESLGFSMYQPVAPNDKPENKQRNRRVEIVLKPAAETEPVTEPAKETAPVTEPAAKPQAKP